MMKQYEINQDVERSHDLYWKGLFSGIAISGAAVLYLALMGIWV